MPILPKIIAGFTTQLSVAIAVGGTTGSIVSNKDDDNVTLPDGLYYFTIDGANAAKEFISCTKTGTALTAIKTVSMQATETSGAARAHRVGASVVITDFATYKAYMDNLAIQGVSDASSSTKGVVKLSVNSVGDPLAVGNDDPRVPSAAPTTLFAPIGLTPGIVSPYIGRSAPTGYLLCDGTAVSRTTYATLFAIMCPSGAFTVTIASPAVFTKASHGLVAGDKIHFTTTGALPTGLAVNTDYFVISTGLTSGAFQVSATRGGSAVNSSGSQSGVHTLYESNFGKGDGSTTFTLPDFTGMTPYGYKASDANFSNLNVPNTYVGEKTHQLTIAELAAHTHNEQATTGTAAGNYSPLVQGANGSGASSFILNGASGSNNLSNPTSGVPTTSTGSDTAHNNMSPYVVTNFIIKT